VIEFTSRSRQDTVVHASGGPSPPTCLQGSSIIYTRSFLLYSHSAYTLVPYPRCANPNPPALVEPLIPAGQCFHQQPSMSNDNLSPRQPSTCPKAHWLLTVPPRQRRFREPPRPHCSISHAYGHRPTWQHTHIHVRERISPQRSHTGQVWQARIPACGTLPPTPQCACPDACVRARPDALRIAKGKIK
jgi:hypothetical protein